MATPPPLIRPEMKYGLIAGAGVSLWFFCEYLFGLHTTRLALGEQTGRFSSLILLLAILTLLKKQQAAFGPLFTLRRGLWSGLFTAAIAATVIYIFLAIYGRFINPGWIDAALNWKVPQLRAAHVAETEIREYIRFYREANSARGLLYSTLINWTLQGSMMALLLTFWFNWRGQKAK
jgi:hypothetical protein